MRIELIEAIPWDDQTESKGAQPSRWGHAERSSTRLPRDAGTGSDEHRPTVLICDDEARLGALTAGLLSQSGYAAQTVQTGEQALEAMLHGVGEVSMLLLDVNLQGLGAREILARMLDHGLKHAVILTSGYAEEDVPRELMDHPLVRSYLAKPYTVDQLIDAVERVLASD
jgi:DNA-binding NtrC family response regulator